MPGLEFLLEVDGDEFAADDDGVAALLREGAEGLGQAGAQTALGEGVFEKIVGGGGMGKIRVAQEV